MHRTTSSSPSIIPSVAPHPAAHASRGTPRTSEQRTDEQEAFARTFPVHVGVDCGKVFHKLVARGPDGRRLKAVKVLVSREGFDDADAYLARMFPAIKRSEMLVGLEFGGHYGFTFAHDLARRGYQIVTVLPSVTKKLKEVEDNSPRKDDAKDAGQICKLLSQGFFVHYAFLDETVAQLRILATERHRLGVEETRLKNRLQAALDTAWPEFVESFSDVDKPTPRALLARWPVAEDVARASTRALLTLVKEVLRNHITPERVRTLQATAKTNIALRTGMEARRGEIARLLTRWDLLIAQIEDVERQLGVLVDQHRGAKALLTVPGIGVVCAATLIAEIGSPETFDSPRQVLKLAGMNLSRRQTGISLEGRPKQTKRGRPLLRRQLFLLAGRWCQTRGLYREQYERHCLTQPKVSAMCAVARKLVPTLLHLMKTGESFDEARWRRTHGLPARESGLSKGE
jgi:transposase